MSHEIEVFADGSAAFASAREDAWHELGSVTTDCMTAEEVMSAAHLGGWNVRKIALTATELSTDGVTTIDVPNFYASVRDHPITGRPEALGVVGADYTHVQNEEHCEFLNLLTDEAGAHFETGGSLRGGRQIFVTMKMPETMTIAGTDRVDMYIAALNAHDGSGAFRTLVTPIRIVCANTQHMAIKAARASYSVRHTSGAKNRINEVRKALGVSFKYMEAFQAEAERMINETLTLSEFEKITEQIWPAPDRDAPVRTRNNHTRRTESLRRLFTSAPTQHAISSTRWAGLQAITEYLDHHAPAKDAQVRATRVLTSATITATKQKAYELLAV